jgi:hypothetical protein
MTEGVALHPGVRVAIARIGMDELGIARALASGELASPQKYENLWLFCIRITGTGLAYRTKWKEHVWRDPSIYCNPDFLARIGGLPVIWEHPPKDTLDTKEYAKRVIGAVMLPFIRGEDVWAVVRVHDENAAKEMASDQLSTSPAVVLRDADSTNIKLEDGSPLLIEGAPKIVDHIAVCGLGVWDKSGPATGVETSLANDTSSETLGERTKLMTPEEEKAADAKRLADEAKKKADAAAIEPDKFLSKLDEFSKRMDAAMKRMDDDDKRRDDAARRKRADDDAARCADDDDDDKFKARMDSEEEEEREEGKKAGEPEETAADKAKRHRADKEAWRADRRKRADDAKKRADAEKTEKEAADAKRKKADDDDAKKRADSILAGNRALADVLAQMPKPATDADYPNLVAHQAKADSAYQALGQRAPVPLQGESEIGYRVRLARGIQQHSKPWAGVDLAALPATALDIAEQQIRADAVAASYSTDSMPEDALIPTRRQTEAGHQITEWRGRHTFIAGLKRPTLRVTEFLTGKGH